MTIKTDWQNFKKVITWNNIKMLICAMIFPTLILYGWTFWAKAIGPVLDKYSQPKTVEESLIYLCITIAFITPIFWVMPSMRFGLLLGEVLGIYKNNRTTMLFFDDVSYNIGDMSEEQRDKVGLFCFGGAIIIVYGIGSIDFNNQNIRFISIIAGIGWMVTSPFALKEILSFS